MAFPAFFDSNVYTFLVLPLLIFLARILDVSLGTMRVIFIARGFKKIAPLISFVEVMIWLAAIRQIMMNLANPACFIAYAAGFATGTYVGMRLEERLSIGKEQIRIVTRDDATKLIKVLEKAGYNLTSIDADSPEGRVHVIIMAINREAIPKVVEIIKKYNPYSFYTIEDIRYVSENHIKHLPRPRRRKKQLKRFGFYRKGK